MKKFLSIAFVVCLVAVPCIYLTIVYNALPARVATHFGLDGEPDDYGSKSKLLTIVILLSLMNIGLYLLFTNLYRIDPKRTARLSKDTMNKIGFAIVFFISVVNIMIIYSSVNNRFAVNHLMLPLLGLFFAYMGNVMYSVKPNYFVGIRTPWALEDEETWRKTHQLAGKLWFAGGIIIAIGALLLTDANALYLMFGITLIITLIPAVFSYRYYQAHKKVT